MNEIICSGIGGQGVLVAGMIIADVAMEDGKNVSWYPSYGFEMRGGAANCEIKIGDEQLQSPYCLEADILFTMRESAIDTWESKVKPGGVMLINSSLVNPDRTYRDAIKVVKVPATEIASQCNNPRGTNIVMLGAMAAASDLYDVDHLRAGMDHYFAKKGKNNPKNAECFNAGAAAVK
ncbi:MAG: 2-oxoacid:acceptor oxidoreductase family protein [Eubacterium sp.]|nr:2-oxoacid:acceptor oxidoreductase family protein [Candidatus Colimonas fimequi]